MPPGEKNSELEKGSIERKLLCYIPYAQMMDNKLHKQLPTGMRGNHLLAV